MILRKNFRIVIVLLAAIASSCTGSSSKKTTTEKSQEQLAEEKTLSDIEKLVEDMPPPSLVPFTLKFIGAQFDKAHIHDIEVAQLYEGNPDKIALNMGVYASDISYLAAYGYEDKCIRYLEKAHDLAEVLGDSAVYDVSHIEEFRGHVANANEDEISELLSKLFLETSLQMEQDHHLTMAGLALTGSFVEGLYQAVITLESYESTEANNTLLEPLVKIVLQEEQALKDIIAVLEDLPYDDTIGDILIELSVLQKLYESDLKAIDENLKANTDYVLTKEVMLDITLEVKRIRSVIIAP